MYTNLGQVGAQNASGIKTHAHMFKCKVLVGYSAVGNSSTETRNLPKAPDNKTPVDSTVNILTDPNIFVTYHDAQAYPEYLIIYK